MGAGVGGGGLYFLNESKRLHVRSVGPRQFSSYQLFFLLEQQGILS